MAERVRDVLGREPAGDDEPAENARWVPEPDVVRSVRAPLRPTARHGGAEGWRERLRWDPGHRGVAALGLTLVAVLAAVAWWLVAGRPTAIPVTAPSGAPAAVGSALVPSSGGVASTVDVPSGGSALPGTSAVPGASTVPDASAVPGASTAAGSVVVDVAGKVVRPGVFTLPAGARVYDALQAAGGARPGVSTVSLNLAAVVQDGQQIVVGAPPGVAPGGVPGGLTGSTAGPVGTSGTAGAAAVVDLNTASLEQLDTLPGVGPVLAQHILDWRDAHGRFTSLDQLNDVSGIGPAKFADLQGLVSL